MSQCKYVDGQPAYDQNWTEYDRIYIEYIVQYTQLMMVFFVKKGLFSSFPVNIPSHHLIPALGLRMKALRAEMIRRGLDTTEGDGGLPEGLLGVLDDFSVEELTSDQQQVRGLFDSLMHMSRYGLKMEELTFPQFERIHIAQNMISICSLAEGYLTASLSYILKKNRALIIRKRRDANLSVSIDNTVFSLTNRSFGVNLNSVEKHLSLLFPISNERKKQLKDLFLIRNQYVHNNGMANNRFLKETNKYKTLTNGEYIKLKELEIEQLLDNLTDVVHMIYKETSIKYLNKRGEQLVPAPQPLEIV